MVIPIFIVSQQWVVRAFSLLLATTFNIYRIHRIRNRKSSSAEAYYVINTACSICLLFYYFEVNMLDRIDVGLVYMSRMGIITATITTLFVVLSRAKSDLQDKIDKIDLGTYTESYHKEIKVLEKEALMILFQTISTVILFSFAIGLLAF